MAEANSTTQSTPTNVVRLHTRSKSPKKQDANTVSDAALDDEVAASWARALAAFHCVIDAEMKLVVRQLKSMDREDAEIVMGELNVSILQRKRAAQLAKVRRP